MTMNDEGRGIGGSSSPNAPACADARDRLPGESLGVLTPAESRDLREHLASCAACRDEAAFVDRLVAARPEPPRTLLPALLASLEGAEARRRREKLRRRRLPWTLSAAAMVVLALGVGLIWNGSSAPDPIWTLALEPETELRWYGDDWTVAGEPVLDALPDDVLRRLLEEMDL